MIDLTTYDVIVVSTSAGKDSLAMLSLICEQARAAGVLDRVVAVHADLGRVEWDGTRDLAERQATAEGVRFEVVSRPQGDLLTHVEQRGMWPSPKQRYCTSDHKRGQIRRVLTKLTDEAIRARCRRSHIVRHYTYTTCRQGGAVRILSCMGMRAQESPARAKLVTFTRDEGASNGKRSVDAWLPIHDWTADQVWARIREHALEAHPAYALGMPRLSCVFCIFSPKSALLLAGKHNPRLLAEYVKVEQKIGHTFRVDLPLVQIQAELAAGAEPGPVCDWRM